MTSRVERIGNCELWLGDCREVMPTLSGVDAVVTDPPYGVDLKGKVTKHTVNRPENVYIDDEALIRDSILPSIRLCLGLFPRMLVFSGIRWLQEYPRARDIGGIVCPNGGGRSPWGFGCYHPALFYGASPYLAHGMGSRPTAKAIYHPGMHVTGEAVGNDHPCPKPIAFMDWAVEAASLAGETILDPFMGSGTTAISCIKLGRSFVGVEIQPEYYEIALRRIEAAYRQADLFVATPVPIDPADARAADLFSEPTL